MAIRIAAKIRTDPCIFRKTCHHSCDWCKTHQYSEACVPALQREVQSQVDVIQKHGEIIQQLRQSLEEKTGSKLYSLEEIAVRLCHSFGNDGCDVCPAANYCHRGHNGMLDWLRKVVGE